MLRNAAAPMSILKTALAAGLLFGAAVFAMPAHADEISLEGQIANARLIAEISSALSSYTHHVDSLAQNLSPESRARVEVQAFADYRRLTWYVSELQSSANPAEVDEFASIQDMIVAYDELQGHVAAAGRSGNLDNAAREAQIAGGVADEINTSMQHIAARDFATLFQTAEAATAVRAASIDSMSKLADAK